MQVDPGFAYAYTLLGHEFALTEELDRALACFRNAIRVNNRHYNAWYLYLYRISITLQQTLQHLMSITSMSHPYHVSPLSCLSLSYLTLIISVTIMSFHHVSYHLSL